MSSDTPATGPRRAVRIGKYEVVAHVATGGMGAVYRARDTENGREVALKVLTPEFAAKAPMVERFHREARHALKLRHENIVAVYEFGEATGTLFIAMEFVDGIDLHEYVRRKGPLEPEEARQIIIQATRALCHAHAQGVIHRDIKPSNFLITRKDGRTVVKLADLGLARDSSGEEFRVTRSGTTVGTLDYMSPEQARDSGLADVRSDLYSLGSTWYHLLAGQVPFAEGGLGERLYRIMNELPADVRQFNPRVSARTVQVLERLLAKKPSRRYQTPDALLEDLEALEHGGPPTRPDSSAEAPIAPSRAPRKVSRQSTARIRPGPRTRVADDTDTNRPVPAVARRASRRHLWYLAGAALAVIVLTGVVLALAFSHRGHRGEEKPDAPPEPLVQPPSVFVKPPPKPAPPPPDVPPPGKEQRPVVTPPPGKTHYPGLYKPAVPIDPAALRKEIEAPWAGRPLTPADAFVCHVGRVPVPDKGSYYPSLAAACAAAPAGKTCVIELCDNGPVFELPLALEGRDLVIRAGKGYRPLLAWDLPRSLAARRGVATAPLVFLDIKGGNLTLEGVEIVVQWTEKVSATLALLKVRNGDLTATDCTFSISGKHRDGLTLALVRGDRPQASRCRFQRCRARGDSLVALDLDAPGAQVLFEGCLVVGGEAPLVRLRADARRGVGLRLVRSTFVSEQTFLRLGPTGASDRRPILKCLAWDTLVARSNLASGGELFHLENTAELEGISWRAVNSLYAGWQTLLAGPASLSSAEIAKWRRQWGRTEGDDVRPDPWPAMPVANPAEAGAAAYRTAGTPVAFAATRGDDQPLGCDLPALTPTRDGWLSLTFEPFVTPPVAVLSDAERPDIPMALDDLFHGGRLNLDSVDLGDYLQRLRKKGWKFAPKVVLHLAGSGERPVTPFRVEGYHLVLYFEPPADEAAPLVLVPAFRPREHPGALIEVAGGGRLDVINGKFRLPDAQGSGLPPFLLHARGGDLRLFRCRLDGPQRDLPEFFRGLVAVDGSGATESSAVRSCALNECVLVSGLDGVRVSGIGARVLVRGSLVVAGADGLHLAPGSACRDRPNIQCLLDRCTIAARGAVVHLEETAHAGVPREPVVVQTLDCAFLNPFPDKPPRAGLLLCEGDQLHRGMVLWQSEGDVYDLRLCVGVVHAGRPLTAKPEGFAAWSQLWGSPGVRRPVLNLKWKKTLEPNRWPLDRLILPPGRGADLTSLGIRPEDMPKKPPVRIPR